ncbi:MAG: cation diffusion facilitator family transporter [Undibacterium sp.]
MDLQAITARSGGAGGGGGGASRRARTIGAGAAAVIGTTLFWGAEGGGGGGGADRASGAAHKTPMAAAAFRPVVAFFCTGNHSLLPLQTILRGNPEYQIFHYPYSLLYRKPGCLVQDDIILTEMEFFSARSIGNQKLVFLTQPPSWSILGPIFFDNSWEYHMSPHSHDTSERNRYLRLAPLSLATCAVELTVGIFAGSLALITDAIHTLLDMFENLLNAFVSNQVRFLRNEHRIRRVGFAGSLILIGLSTAFMAHEAILVLFGREAPRLIGWTVAVAVFSLIMNLWQLRIHFGAPEEHRNLTHWGQALHLMTDVAGSITAIIGTAASAVLGIAGADAWAAILIVTIIWWRMIYTARQTFGRGAQPARYHCPHRH